jgi:hypothetical protein
MIPPFYSAIEFWTDVLSDLIKNGRAAASFHRANDLCQIRRVFGSPGFEPAPRHQRYRPLEKLGCHPEARRGIYFKRFAVVALVVAVASSSSF